jgi:hypothetical protein
MGNWFGDLMLGQRPDMRYTGAQDAIIGRGTDYGFQANPLYDRTLSLAKLYSSGKDKKGRLTKWMKPVIAERGNARDAAVDRYERGMAPGFNAGGGQLTAGGAAHIERMYDSDTGDMLMSGHVQREDMVNDRVDRMFENAKGRELEALRIAAGVANEPYNGAREGFGLLGDLAKGGIDYLTGYGSKWLDKALPKPG